ncbi:Translation initiation factor IF-2 like protein [Verticillium longisporum]|uniref:Translation initiation factor IF-2 like protein n=1 Tax=Verticillium longisporum TaxID=100787 RepID=A0A8I2ZP12_VERLO|nr:Translation initiation factor IF-2 like protein [Verticillium longisporum]
MAGGAPGGNSRGRGGKFKKYTRGGKIDALKHGKKDVTEMRKGTECGISFEGYQDFQVGDQVQTYEEVREKRTLGC